MQAGKNTHQLYSYVHPPFSLLVLSAVVYIAKRVFPFLRMNSSAPTRVGTYVLIESLQEGLAGYACGVYIDAQGKKVLIKTWNGRIRDLRYYHLIKEYFITIHLYRKLSMLGKIRVRVPKPLACYTSHQALSVVYEYISGASLDSFSEEEQSAALMRISYDLTTASGYIGSDSMELIPSRGVLYYLARLPFLLVYRLFTSPGQVLRVAGWSRGLRTIDSLFLQRPVLTLAHRKLLAGNVLVRGNDYYLLSCGSMVFTLPFYDVHALVFRSGLVSPFGGFRVYLSDFLLAYLFLYQFPQMQKTTLGSSGILSIFSSLLARR